MRFCIIIKKKRKEKRKILLNQSYIPMNQIDGILSDNLLLLCSVKFGYKQIINKFVQLVNVSTINHASTQCRLPLLSIRWKSLNVCMYVCLCLLCAFVYPRKKKRKNRIPLPNECELYVYFFVLSFNFILQKLEKS